MSLAVDASRDFSDAPDFAYRCPTCNVGFLVPDRSTFVKVEPSYSNLAHGHDAWDPHWITLRFSVTCVCNKTDCGETAFVTGDGGVDERYDYDGQAEYYESFRIKSFFPSPRLCYVPPETPTNVKDSLERSFTLYWADVSAAANSLRASLEALLNELQVPNSEKNRKEETVRMNLNRRLEVWARTHQNHADLCHALGEVGNLGSHGERVNPKHYIGSLEVYSYVLKELFDNNAQKMKELAQSIRNEIKAKAR
jgi:hypothetical protein